MEEKPENPVEENEPYRAVHVFPPHDCIQHYDVTWCECQPRIERNNGMDVFIHRLIMVEFH